MTFPWDRMMASIAMISYHKLIFPSRGILSNHFPTIFLKKFLKRSETYVYGRWADLTQTPIQTRR